MTSTSRIDEEQEEGLDDYRAICSRVLGEIVGKTLNAEESEENQDGTIFASSKLQGFVESSVLPGLKSSAFSGLTVREKDRYDRMAISGACSSNAKLAESIVQAHLSAFYDAVNENLESSTTDSTREALSFILRHSRGENVIRAFHSDEKVDAVLDELSRQLISGTSARLRASISQIALPATSEEQKVLMSRVSCACLCGVVKTF